MNRRLIFASSLVAFSMQTGCNPNGGSDLRSLLGLEAGQDEKIRQTSNAEIYIALSDWFQTFRASPNGEGGSKAAANLSTRVPPAATKLMQAYLKDQIARHDALEDALDKRDNAKLTKLLELETLEMKDIALALLSNSSDWQPPSGDKLAMVIVASRRHSNFADRFATKDFLERLFDKSTTYQLVEGAETQRKNYLAALISRYVGDASAHAALRSRIAKNRRVMANMLESLDRPVNKSQLALTDDSGSAAATTGPSAVMLSFITSGQEDAVKKAKSYSKAAQSTPTLSDDVANSSDGSTPQSGEEALKANPYTSLDSPNPAYQAFFEAAPPDLSTIPPFDPNAPAPSPEPSSNTSNIVDPTQPTLVDQEILASITSKGSLGGKLPKKPLVGKPAIDCTKFGVSGAKLVSCQRNLAYADAKWTSSKKTYSAPWDPIQPSQGGDTSNVDPSNSGTSSGESSTALIKAFIVQGFTDDGSGDTTQQGSMGSCTQHAMHSVLRMNIRRYGKMDPNKELLSTGSEINNLFQTTQGGQPMMDAAIQAAQSQYGSNLDIQSQQVSSWAEAREILVKTGRPLFIGLGISQEWMANGGGAEFQLTDQGSGEQNALALAGSLQKLSCGNAGGHAVAIVGFIGNDPIIKNSWGAEWGQGGLALVDGATCMSGQDSVIYDITVIPKG